MWLKEDLSGHLFWTDLPFSKYFLQAFNQMDIWIYLEDLEDVGTRLLKR